MLALALALLSAAVSSTSAARAEARTVDFAAARALADANAPDIQVSAQQLALARAEIKAVAPLINPTLSVATSQRTASLSTSLSVPVLYFGRRRAALGVATAAAGAAQEDVLVARLDARLAVSLAWIDLWSAQERAGISDAAAGAADRLATATQDRFDAGAGPRVDAVRAAANRALVHADANAARSAIRSAAARLAVLIGVDPATELLAAGEIGFPALLPSASDLALLQARHPLLERDRADQRTAVAAVRSEQRERWPLVAAQVTVDRSDPTLPGDNVTYGVGLDLPLLDQRRGAIARAHAQGAVAVARYDADAKELTAALLDADAAATTARARLESVRRDVVAGVEEAERMTEDAFHDGRVDLLRLLEAQRATSDARLAAVESAAAWGRAVAALEHACGQSLTPGAGDAR